jgi:geranylgeranyl diphosphate synthase type II
VKSHHFSYLVTDLQSKIEEYLVACVPQEPASLYEPVRTTLYNGGKRVRPQLTALTYRLTAEDDGWVRAGVAVELLHTFTLLHDDIMDNAETRRGKPAVHATYGLNAAILSGDVIVALATEALAKCRTGDPTALFAEFGSAFQAVCEGQALDKEFETRDDITVDEYLHMIDLKTAKVIELAATLGAIAGGGRYLEQARRFAHHLGISFQIRDDLLDLTADQASFGKTIGGDILEGKRTILFALASARQSEFKHEERSLFERIRTRSTTTNDISSARAMFERLGVLSEAARLARISTERAMAELEGLPASEARKDLSEFAGWLLARAT